MPVCPPSPHHLSHPPGTRIPDPCCATAGRQIKGPSKSHRGELGTAVTIGGIEILPGDIIRGDDDGLVVVPEEDLAEVVAAGLAGEKDEVGVLAQLDAGATTLDIYG